MTARLTQAYLQVIYLEDLTVINKKITHTISFGQSLFRADRPGNTILWTQSATLTKVSNRSFNDTLSFTQSVTVARTFRQSASSDLSLTDTAAWKKALPTKTASSTLSLSSTCDWSRPAGHILALSQQAVGQIEVLGGPIANSITFTHAVSVAVVLARTVVSPLSLTGTATETTVFQLEAENFLTFSAFSVDHDPNDEPFDGDLRDEVLPSFAQVYVLLQAPFNSVQQTIQLPKPLFQDTEHLVSSLSQHHAVDGTLRTYIKKLDDRRIEYTFSITRDKALELQEFFDVWNGAEMKLVNWKGEVWKVKLESNPVDFTMARRSSPGGPGSDVSLTFEGKKLYG